MCMPVVFAGLLLFFVVVAVAGCAQSGRLGSSTSPPQEALSYSYVELTLAQAQGMAKQREHPFRAVKLDGVDLQVTLDFIPGRINAQVVSGVVVASAVEGNGRVPMPASDNVVSRGCLVFFDGCNRCRRSAPGQLAACTRKACAAYEAPYCLDD